MNLSIPQIFDINMNRLAYLENASSVGYELPLNELWTASFSLPADDPKNEHCEPNHYVEIYDGETRIDLFRIIGEDLTRSDEAYRVYTCEHVLATLLNDVLFKDHQIGGTNVRTPDVLKYILDHQTTERWVLDKCGFSRQFEYNFENSNLLAALYAVPNCFDVEYQWEWDTTVYPWRLSLNPVDDTLKAEIRYRKNLLGIRRTKDASQIINRIYALGYGEGVNQLTIESVNGGVPYLDDLPSQQEYGIISSILVDSRYEHAESLKAYALQVMSQAARPYISYEVDVLDLFRLNGDEFGRFWPGWMVRVLDDEDGITLRTRIVNVSKSDLREDPGRIQVTLANKGQNIAGSISDLQNRALINETYAQGATNLMVQTFADNADKDFPATMKVWIPASAVRINKIGLNISFEPFRGYSKTVKATKINLSSTASGGGSTTTSTATDLPSSNIVADDQGGANAKNHNHGIAANTRLAVVNGNNEIISSVGWTPSGAHGHGSHSHDVTVPAHFHSITMPEHGHEMQYGIWTGETASSAVIKVDGEAIPPQTDYADIDIVSYLSTDDSGKILRDTWHTIEIEPNTQSRIIAALFTQLFTNSRGGGDY